MKKTIKTVIIIIVLVVLAIIAYNAYKSISETTVTKTEFDKANAILNHRIEYILQNQDSIKQELAKLGYKVDTVNIRLDTIQAVDILIYQSMQENTGKTIWDWLKFE